MLASARRAPTPQPVTRHSQAATLSSRSCNNSYGAILRQNLSRSEPRTGQPIFVRMLWLAFPARSEHQLAELAAPVLGVTHRQVRNWLRGTCDGKTKHMVTLVALIGIERFARLIEGGTKD